MGAADGKIAVGLAGVAPPALLVGVIIQGLVFVYARLRGRQAVRLPGAVGFYLGAAIATLVMTSFEHVPAPTRPARGITSKCASAWRLPRCSRRPSAG